MSGSEKYVCVHGHFYQPPRKNPWLEVVEVEDSAAPYHDWNDRINAECYAANGSSRILNDRDKIVRIVNNYSRISFNFGPTLLSWLQGNAPRTYQMVLDADRLSRDRFGGHGSAIAQVYNHVIMPLASSQDKLTQVLWGIADFEHRFRRKPEGMWLAETAVDLETLDLLAQHGIEFTILAPHQCARVRPLPTENDPEAPPWHETPNASVDPTQPYFVRTREGHRIAVFFYDGPVSRAVAFEGILGNGANFARRLLDIGNNHGHENGRPAQLAHIATDGESYGHHHRHGDMALAYALESIERHSDAKLTNYSQFLAEFPPTREAELHENTSWSCAHGIERWRADCGCGGGHPGWNQRWRAPLREALDWLRDAVRPLCEQAAVPLFGDAAALLDARNAYIAVILDRNSAASAPASSGTAVLDEFFLAHASHPLDAAERTQALKLMELERNLQLMYTSCGWFFDEISGIEPVQVLSYAGRALQLAQEISGKPGATLEPEFLRRLELAKSNVPEMKNGAEIYRRRVLTRRIGLEEVGAHYAVSLLFEAYPDNGRLFCYDVLHSSCDVLSSGRARIVFGHAEICSRITLECEPLDFAVLHLGDQNLSAAVRRCDVAEGHKFEAFENDIRHAVALADLPEVVRLFDRYFGSAVYSLSALFRDEQRRILQIILDSTLGDMEATMRAIYVDHTSLLDYLTRSGMPKPRALMLAAQFSLNGDMRQAMLSEPFDTARLRELLARAANDEIPLDETLLSYVARESLHKAMRQLQEHAGDIERLQSVIEIVDVLRELPFAVDFWAAQNIWNRMTHSTANMPAESDPAQTGTQTEAWIEPFRTLGTKLDLEVDQLTAEE